MIPMIRLVVRAERIDQMIIHQCGIDGGCDGIYLGGITGSEYGENSEDRKTEWPASASFSQDRSLCSTMGAANQVAFLIYFAEMHGQSYPQRILYNIPRIAEIHIQKTETGPDGDGSGYSGDVAGAYRGARAVQTA